MKPSLLFLALLLGSGAVAAPKAVHPAKKHRVNRPHGHASYHRHEGYCTERDYKNGCSLNDSFGTGGAMPVGIYCQCGVYY